MAIVRIYIHTDIKKRIKINFALKVKCERAHIRSKRAFDRPRRESKIEKSAIATKFNRILYSNRLEIWPRANAIIC